jgi:hypothetical protein
MEDETKYFHNLEFFMFVVLTIDDPFGKKRLLEKVARFLDGRDPTKV